ncbi:Solute carrier organic anion transporter family member [Aphelenchoides besseyi]|nr:Solute carrier organic anion transporter family member [Aphelenchoides besseyi]
MRQGTWQNSARLHSRTRSSVGFSSKPESVGFVQYFTVCCYIVCVSAPAIALGIYYTCLWDPSYASKNLNHTTVVKFPSNQSATLSRIQGPKVDKCDCQQSNSEVTKTPKPRITLKNILASVTAPTSKQLRLSET